MKLQIHKFAKGAASVFDVFGVIDYDFRQPNTVTPFGSVENDFLVIGFDLCTVVDRHVAHEQAQKALEATSAPTRLP